MPQPTKLERVQRDRSFQFFTILIQHSEKRKSCFINISVSSRTTKNQCTYLDMAWSSRFRYDSPLVHQRFRNCNRKVILLKFHAYVKRKCLSNMFNLRMNHIGEIFVAEKSHTFSSDWVITNWIRGFLYITFVGIIYSQIRNRKMWLLISRTFIYVNDQMQYLYERLGDPS